MKLSEIANLLDAKIYCGEEFLDKEVQIGVGSDLMSDVLAYVTDEAILLTGLVNPQVIRTAEMMDMKAVILLRGKTPTDAMIELADARSIIMMSTEKGMFHACGILYNAGVESGDGL